MAHFLIENKAFIDGVLENTSLFEMEGARNNKYP